MIYGSLDLAAQTGVAWGRADSLPEFDTWRLGGEGVSRGRRGLVRMQRLVTWLADVKPDLVFIEAPMNTSGKARKHSGAGTDLALSGYIFMAETICASRHVPTKLLQRQDVLLHFTGASRYKVKGMAKKNCMVRACQLKWQVDNEDEADAGAMWHYGISLENQAAMLKRSGIEPPKFSRRKLV